MVSYLKKNNNYKYIIFISVIFILSLLYNIKIIPFVIIKERFNITNKHIKYKDSLIHIFGNYNFSSGRYQIYIINKNNNKLPKVMFTKNIKLLKKIKRKYIFKETGGDIATAESTLYVIKDNKIIFEVGVILDEAKFGLQSTQFGWIEPINKEIFTLFYSMDKCYKPLIVL